jgi:hypothetical protein
MQGCFFMRRLVQRHLCLSFCVLALFAAAGCAPNATPEERSMGVRNIDPKQRSPFISDRNNDTIDRRAPRIEDRDDYMGRSQNPNMILGDGAARNQQVDIRNMQMMAKSVPGVEHARITLSGGNAFVTLDLIPNVTAAQARTIERQVIDALRLKIPRYDFHVTSNDGYHR